MKTLIMYQLEDIKDDKAVTKLLSKHFPNGAEKFGANVFLPLSTAPDFCKLVGFSAQQNTSTLEQIAGVISQEGYDRKVDKFNKKTEQLKQKLVDARKTSNVQTGVSGCTGITNIGDLINQTENIQKQKNSDPKVAKAKNKLDSFLAKNKQLIETSKYTTTGKVGGGHVSFGAGTTSNEKNIFQEIEAEKKKIETFANASMEKFKKLLGELLKLVPKVGVMTIEDGNKTPTINTRRNVQLQDLAPIQLMKAQNREMFYITK